jgi:hypothetical protein
MSHPTKNATRDATASKPCLAGSQALLVGILIALLIVGCSRSTPTLSAKSDGAAAALPSLPEHSILRPEFSTNKGVLKAGTAFAVNLANHDRPLILTALHLFGPNGGLAKQIPSEELAGFVSGATLYDAFTGEAVATTGPMIALPGAVPFGEESDKDMAACWPTRAEQLGTLSLASSRPAVDEPVWLAASVLGGAPRDQKLHRATVRISEDDLFQFEYENTGLNLIATSGAPILNRRGEVVGINVGGAKRGGKSFGIATPLDGIRSLLSKIREN